MSIFSPLSHDPMLRLLGFGHGHQDGWHDGDGLRFGYPMNTGDTLSTIAGKLQIPINELLNINPELHADSPLTPGLDIALPTNHIDRVINNITQLTRPDMSNHPTPGNGPEVPRPSTPPSSADPRTAPTAPVPPSSNSQDARVPPARSVGDSVAGNRIGASPDTSTVAQRVVVGDVSQTPFASERSTYVVTDTTSSKSTATALPADEVSFSHAARATIGTVQSQQDGSLPPPPFPQNTDNRVLPLFNTSAVQTSWVPQAVPAGWNTVMAATGSNDARLQIMALLAAQIGGASISNGPVTGQTPGFIDPQAVAAYANSMRPGHSIDLGGGRRMEFSLASDQLRRVGAIGEEGRAVSTGSRRTGDGLDEVQQDERTESDQETQDGHEERQHERRRLAAIAAIRRRRRPLSTRCRYWHGERRPLYASSGNRYPNHVDLAEFRGRLPRRYLWTATPGPARPDDR
jgi:LysM repeat protein